MTTSTTPRAIGLLRSVLANVGARAIAVAALAAATVAVAWSSGPEGVGVYALLRMLPGMVGVLAVGGLPGALAYFLAEPRRGAPRLWPTLAAIAVVGGIAGSAVWLALSPLIGRFLLPDVPWPVVAATGVTVATQLLLTCAKTALQGLGDRRGSDVVIALEEVAFLPCFGLALLAGIEGAAGVVLALAAADLVVGVAGWQRVARHLGWARLGLSRTRGWLGRPNSALAREVLGYGMRGQVGGLLTLLNLRLDFLFLSAIAGAGPLGVYAVASKYAELLRLPATALTWVTYPRLAGLDRRTADRQARRLVPAALGAVVAGAGVLALLCGPVIDALYDERFAEAPRLALILLTGLLLGGAGGVASGYLYARGRPGLNSVLIGVGVVLTVSLDLVLIPRAGAEGAAVASTVAYATTDLLLLVALWRITRKAAPGLDLRVSTARRMLDIVLATLLLVVAAPVIVLAALAILVTDGRPVTFTQTRVGEQGRPFPLHKLRTMRAGGGGPEVTTVDDPRVTRVGALLRRTSVDELPQLWDVLVGRMTFVGPRPETVALAGRYPGSCRFVLLARPGLTGPTQLTYRERSATPPPGWDAEEWYVERLVPLRVGSDLEFLEQPTLGRTLRYLGLTALLVLGLTDSAGRTVEITSGSSAATPTSVATSP